MEFLPLDSLQYCEIGFDFFGNVRRKTAHRLLMLHYKNKEVLVSYNEEHHFQVVQNDKNYELPQVLKTH